MKSVVSMLKFRFVLPVLLFASAQAVAPILATPSTGLAGDTAAPLNDRHKEWLETEVNYIIAEREREIFLKLTEDALRDQFIEMFWKQRDPTPSSFDNEFKEEHYRRLAYANTWFGSRRAKDGWRSDRGRIYILFGEPQQKTKFTGENDIRDCEIWFYDSQARIRDVPFFRLLFYQRSFAHDFVLYSPTQDGPQELAMQIAPTREQALRYLYERAGQELWEAAQSFIPTEPLRGGWSPESELLISKIENYRNTLVDADWADNFLITRGRVSTKLSFRNLPMSLVMRTIYNLRKEAVLHIGFQIRPEDLHVEEYNERYYSVFDIRTFIEDAESGAEVVARSDHWETQFSYQDGQIRARPIAFQQAIPLVPGRYRILWIIDDLVRSTFSFRQADIKIEGPESSRPFLSVPLLTSRYTTLEPSRGEELHPFRVFNLQYAPDLFGDYNQGDNLSVFFQFLFPPEKAPSAGIRFVIEARSGGDPASEPIVFEHSVPSERLAPEGVVFVHRQIPVSSLSPGEYMLQASAFAGGELKAESQAVPFSFVGEQVLVRPRPDVFVPDFRLGSPEYVLERTRQFEVLGSPGRAIQEIRTVLAGREDSGPLGKKLNELEQQPVSPGKKQ